MKSTINRTEPVVSTITLEVSVKELTDIVYWTGKGNGNYPLYAGLLTTWREVTGRTHDMPAKTEV